MTDNKMRIWDALSKTDPKHTKSFSRSGGFKGTAMKPIWIIKQMTELFGPAGCGWGMGEPVFQTVAAGDEVLVFCTVRLWYNENGLAMDGGLQGVVYGVGGDKVLGKNKYGPFTNDEAFKAAYTDAMSNAMKQIGVGADIHMGLFDDEKYVRETLREFASGGIEGRTPPNETTGAFPADPDVLEAAKRWVNDSKTLHTNMQLEEDVKAWHAKYAKALVKLKGQSEPMYEDIMKSYGVALDRVRRA